MKNVPSLSAKETIRILKKLGFEETRQKGSHLVLFNRTTKRRTVVPVHAGKNIKKPLLIRIIREDAGISIEEFLKAR